jgi:predicted DNA-binding antitoxin AbrB/MazE fold protein
MLPVYIVEVEKVINPDKSYHRVYWEWVTIPVSENDISKKNIVPPTFKNGIWKLSVDIVSTDKTTRSHDAGESDEAFSKLMFTASNNGFKEITTKIEKTNCSIDLQNGVLKILAKKVAIDDGYIPEIKIVYIDKDDSIKTSFNIILDNAKNLTDIAEVFINLSSKF